MSKNRWVNTRFWTDTYISRLEPIEKLLFLYLITNEDTALCGAYEIPLRRVAADTGIEVEAIEEILRRFSVDDKISYIDGYVVIKNYRKHQATNTNIELGIEREENELPEHILESLRKPFKAFGSNPIPNLNPKPKLKHLRNKDNGEENKKQGCLDFLKMYNGIFNTNYTSVKGLLENFSYWSEEYSLYEMQKAIQGAKKDTFWSSKMTPSMLLRQKNPRGEKVDYIGQFLNSQVKLETISNSQLFTKEESMPIPEEERIVHSEKIRENLKTKLYGSPPDG